MTVPNNFGLHSLVIVKIYWFPFLINSFNFWNIVGAAVVYYDVLYKYLKTGTGNLRTVVWKFKSLKVYQIWIDFSDFTEKS